MAITTEQEFKDHVAAIQDREGYQAPAAFAIGVARYGKRDESGGPAEDAPVLDVYYPTVNVGENQGSAAVFADAVRHQGGSATYRLSGDQLDTILATFKPWLDGGDLHSHANILAAQFGKTVLGQQTERPLAPQAVVVTFIDDLTNAPVCAHDVYLRLHLLSHRKIQPHGANLDGAFGLLTNVAWTDHGPIEARMVNCIRGSLRAKGESLRVISVDKFPRMVDYVVPSGVRIADADRVRLGAHLAEGTTIMHEGFVNFNAGTLGHSMVEGRISAGVVVGDGSDVGGGSSIMGTLSGGNSAVISVGKGSLLGANSGLGISLGDGCTIEAGLYVTGGSKVTLLPEGTVVKAAALSGKDDLLFRRNSQSGVIEVLNKKADFGGLNAQLHANA